MPIHEYRCRACGERFEKLVRGAASRPSCPACEGRKVERLPSAFGIGGGGGKAASRSARSGGCSSCKGGSCSSCR